MRRKIYDEILKWKKRSAGQTALLIDGARRVGKSYIAEKFAAAEYKSYLLIDFNRAPKEVTDLFDNYLNDLDTLFMYLSGFYNTKLYERETLIILDEVQLYPRARSAIKYLVADGRYDYLETGSLMSIKKNVKDILIPSEEEHLKMYPLDFEEYLWANGVQDKTLQYLKNCYDRRERVSDSVHETLCKLFYSYLVVGGMPETVQIYIDTHDIAKVVLNQRSILNLYRLDIAKYAEGSDKAKIKAIFDSIPAQLNEKNRRFKLNSINASARHIRYEDSFNWLADAGVALPCYNVTEPQAPLQLSEKRNLFKLYMNDVGLLCASCMENIQFDLLMGNVEINMGSILENAFAQNLKSNGFELHYYDSKKIGELDFVLQKGLHTELVEIKSGNDFKKHLAMDHAMKVEQWEFEQSIVFSKSNIEKEADVLYLPWYMILFFMQEKEPEKLIYEIDLSGL